MKVKIIRMAGFFGLLIPLLSFIISSVSIRMAPWFSWAENTFFDLGVSGSSAVIFNNGLLMTGSLMMVFSLGLLELTKGCWTGRFGSILYLGGSFFLCGLGIFSETAIGIHYFTSLALFVILFLSLLLIGVFMTQNGLKEVGIPSLVAGAFSGGLWLLLLRAESAAIIEVISFSTVGLWSAFIGIWMRRIKREDLGKNAP